MTEWAITNDNDVVVFCGKCLPTAQPEDFSHMRGNIHLPAPDGTTLGGKLLDGVFSPRPVQPGPWHVFDESAFDWVLPIDHLDLAKMAAKERINASWKLAEQSPFIAYGKAFDADDKAIQRILGAAQAALVAKTLGQSLTIEWTCADNSTLTMDTDMLAAIPMVIAQHADSLHKRGKILKSKIEAATTIEQIDAVVWELD